MNADRIAEEPLEEMPDERLAALVADGIDAAERALIRRYMQAIYWLPRRAFGAPEDALGEFLLFAVDKLRARDILARYDPGAGARFSTWFGVVIRRLYLDFLRSRADEPGWLALEEEAVPAKEESPPPAAGDADAEAPGLLGRLAVRCRTLFKLLLCHTWSLTPEEMRWIAAESGRSLLDAAEAVARLEERLRGAEAKLQERYDRLAVVFWWKTRYERELRRLERGAEKPWSGEDETLAHARGKLERRRAEYERIAGELSGAGGAATAPYRELAGLLNLKEGTLASRISRCRARAAELVGRTQRTEE